MRERLIELLDGFVLECVNNCPKIIEGTKECHKCAYGKIADYLIANGVIVPPCKVGDTVYYVSDSPINLCVQANTIYEAHVSRMVTTQYGTTLVIQIHNSYGCTEIPDIDDWGKTVFLTREEAEKALKRKEDENAD